MSPLPARPGPRPRTWLALVALVLMAHAAAVLDWGALWALTQAPDQAGVKVATSVDPRAVAPQAPRPLPQPAVVRVAQVRWIATPANNTPHTTNPTQTPRSKPVLKTPTPKTPAKTSRAAPPSPPPPPPGQPATSAELSAPARDNPPQAEDTVAQAAATSDAAAAPPTPDTASPATDNTPTPAEAIDATPSVAPSPPVNAAPSSPALQAAEPRPALLPGNRWLRYDVTGQAKGLNYRASGEIRWQANDGRYQADLKISAFLLGSRSQQSTGRLTDTGLVPERFADKSRSERAAHFEPEQGRIRFSNNAPDAPWLPGTQDRLSVFFQLAAWLNARPDSLREGQRLSLPVAGTGGADQWHLLVQTQEPLDLPAGRWDTLRVEVLPQKTFDQRVELWLAPKLDHLPVRIRITQGNGDVVDQQLSALP